MVLGWSDSLLTGVDSVDNQHKELIERAIKLEKAVADKDKAVVAETMAFLQYYVTQHFKDEEELMLKHNYPGYDAQKNAHDLFVKKLAEIKEGFESTGVTTALMAKLKVNVNSWLVGHINTMDKQLGKYMQEKGL